jgi:hypothetical protein
MSQFQVYVDDTVMYVTAKRGVFSNIAADIPYYLDVGAGQPGSCPGSQPIRGAETSLE